MKIRAQKRMAASLLKCGKNRVFINPEAIDDVSMAITRDDIKNLIKNHVIRKRYIIGTSRVRANALHLKKLRGRARGFGSRKGSRTAREPSKRKWINRIRPLRRELRRLRTNKKIKPSIYRELYLKAKGGVFVSVSSLHRYIEEKKLMRGK